MATDMTNPPVSKGYLSMSQRLIDRPGIKGANPKHLANIIEYLCKHNNRDTPQLPFVADHSAQQKLFAEWLTSNFTNIQIDWADQQIKEVYRLSGQKYKVFDGRGRPVGSKNKLKSFSSFAELGEAGQTPVLDKLLDNPNDDNPNIGKQTSDIAQAHNFVTKTEFNAYKDQDEQIYISLKKSLASLAEGGIELSKAVLALDDRVSKITIQAPTIIEIKRPELPTTTNIGLQHHCFPKLLKACNAVHPSGRHMNIMLVGPASTGKTHASEQIHQAIFGSKYPFRACGMSIFAHEFMGYMHGDKYVRSQFREAFEHGGIFVADEFDRYAASATVALNNALAGTQAAFPDGMVKRHADFIFIACANTSGAGSTQDYNTAQKQDASTINRFITIAWPIDLSLEDSLAYNKEWLAIVRRVRYNVNSLKIKGIMITSRQVMDGQALISAGYTVEEAEEACLRQGLDDNQWDRVRQPISNKEALDYIIKKGY